LYSKGIVVLTVLPTLVVAGLAAGIASSLAGLAAGFLVPSLLFAIVVGSITAVSKVQEVTTSIVKMLNSGVVANSFYKAVKAFTLPRPESFGAFF
jgi:uncharacterized membrane protein YfcA